MGTLIERFKLCLERAGADVRPGRPFIRPESRDWDAHVWDVYQRLGGVQPPGEFRAKPGSWDLLVDGINLEFDEWLHFNGCRLATLDSPIYPLLTFPLEEYRSWCVGHEGDCRKAGSFGGKWTSTGSEKQFGPAGRPGELTPPDVPADVEVTTGKGSPRWRQRALYDFCKDAWVLCSDGVACRIAIWDLVEVGGVTRTVKAWLEGPCSDDVADALLQLVRRRTFRKR